MNSSLYIDAFSGVAGDMLLSALVDIGTDVSWLVEQLQLLPIGDFALDFTRTTDRGLSGTSMKLTAPIQVKYRHLDDITKIIQQAGYSAFVADNSLRTFQLLAEAESRVHGCRPDQVHFHEVGALDTLIDICGYFLCLERLGRPHVFCSPLPMPSGSINIAHGEYPLPAPAITYLLKGFHVCSSTASEEMVTPTGAALLAISAESIQSWPSFRITQTGYGAGTPGRGPLPNLVRIIKGEHELSGDQISIIEAQMDDITPEILAYVGNLLLLNGAVDYFITPIVMKKSRPGFLLSVFTSLELEPEIIQLILVHTSTIGVRYYRCARQTLPRHSEQVATPYGLVSVKVAYPPGCTPRIAPEYEDCARIAQQFKLSLQEIYLAAQQSWQLQKNK